MPASQRKANNIILDIDNTLLHALYMDDWLEIEEENPQVAKYLLNKYKHVKMDDDFMVFQRPGYDQFLQFLFSNFNVAVWSAGSPSYVEWIVNNMILKNTGKNTDRKLAKLDFVYSSNECSMSNKTFKNACIKDLRLVWKVFKNEGYKQNNTVIIDDLVDNTYAQGRNSIHVPGFCILGEEGSDILDLSQKEIMEYLKKRKPDTVLQKLQTYLDKNKKKPIGKDIHDINFGEKKGYFCLL